MHHVTRQIGSRLRAGSRRSDLQYLPMAMRPVTLSDDVLARANFIHTITRSTALSDDVLARANFIHTITRSAALSDDVLPCAVIIWDPYVQYEFEDFLCFHHRYGSNLPIL